MPIVAVLLSLFPNPALVVAAETEAKPPATATTTAPDAPAVPGAPAPAAPAAPAPGGAAAQAAKPSAPLRNIGGPGDYGLRERLVKRLLRDEAIAAAAPRVVLVNGGVVLSGTMPTWSARRRALVIASAERGILNVTDQLQVARGDVKDSVILKGVADLLKEQTTPLEIKDLQIGVEDGVVTLDGTTRNFAARVRAEEIAGTVLGVTTIHNRLRPRTAPSGTDDASIRSAVATWLRDWKEYSYVGSIEVQVRDGKVTLTGALPIYIGRQQAGTMTALVGGVREVENRIMIDPSLQPNDMVIKEIP